MEAGSIYFDMGRFLTTPCYEMFPKGLVWAENVWEDIGEQRTGQWALRGRDSRPRQSQQATLTLPLPPFTVFLTPSPTATRGMQAGEQLFLPSIHSSVCVCVRDLKTERKLTSFDRLEHVPFCLVMVTAEYRSIYTRFAKAIISAASFQVIPVNRHSYDDGVMNKTFT